MKKWQILQLFGSAIVLFGLFFQIFVISIFEKDASDVVESAYNHKLTHIYKTIKDKNYVYNPEWEDIDRFYRGEETDDLSYFTFEEFLGTAKVVNMGS